MIKEIVVDVSLMETRLAILEDKELVEIYIERPDNKELVGNIYRGKVCSVLPGMQAAFVDIGYEKNAFLYVGDAVPLKSFEEFENGINIHDYKIEDLLKTGQEITVQVVKEPFGNKGPRVSTHITLPGRHCVYVPYGNYIGISRRIENEEERERLKKIAEDLKPKESGIIVRTAAENKTQVEIEQDMSFLISLWEKISNKEGKGTVPRCIHKEVSLITKAARDLFTRQVDRFIINDRGEYNNVIEMVELISPALKMRVEYFNKNYDIFEYYHIESQISRALSRIVWLKCGGYLVIDKTEALTVIDVNTGKYTGNDTLEETVLRANIEAAKEIARQIRLRDLGGIIIVDFIDMKEQIHRDMILDVLKESVKRDRTKTIVVGMTGLGLIEMTRKKVRQSLQSVMTVECPNCNATGRIPSPETIAKKVEKKIKHYFVEAIANTIKIEVHPSVAEILAGVDGDKIELFEKEYGKKIDIVPVKGMKYDGVNIKEV